MLLLASTADLIRVITGQAVTTDVHASWVDMNGSTVTPGRTNSLISTATTTAVVGSPASSTFRTVKTLTVRNRHASSSVDVTVVHFDGSNAVQMVAATLSAGDALHYDEHNGFTVRDNRGRVITRSDGLVAAAVQSLNTVILASDVTNNNGTANTIANVTGLAFPTSPNETYWFEFVIAYTSAATTTGSRWSITGPSSPTMLNYRSEYTLTATSMTVNSATAYDIPAAANASSLTAGNVATLWGIIRTAGTGGDVTARFASEVASSAIVAKAGSACRWMRTL